MNPEPAQETVLDERAVLVKRILEDVETLMDMTMAPKPFQPGRSPVPYSGTVATGQEYRAMVESILSGWFGLGKAGMQFERAVAQRLGRKRGLFVNSGSSANLIATKALMSRKLQSPLAPGDEVITCVSGFPTTLNPLLQNGLRPVFVDSHIPTYNPTAEQVGEAITPRTRAIVLAHTLGNPLEMRGIMDLVTDHGLRLIEDCCDALGSTYEGARVGSFGDVATCSFYPAHHITTGEGGLVSSDDTTIMRAAESLRDWGRDCWCAPGEDATCGKRFGWTLGTLPSGYDHKYIYSEIGYNLKPLESQAAFGLVQIERLDGFNAARRANFARLHAGLRDLTDILVLPEPTPGSDPAWFAFPIHLREGFDRRPLVQELESRGIATRMLFGSNLLRHPAYESLDTGAADRFPVADAIMERTFFVGTSPRLSSEMVDYIIEAIHDIAPEVTSA